MIQNSKEMPGLVFCIDKANETTKENASIILDTFKESFDHRFDKLGLDNWETANDIIKESLSTQNFDDSFQKIQDLVKERSKPKYGPKNFEDCLNFARFVMRMLHLSEFEPDNFCVDALKQFQRAFAIRYFREIARDGGIRFEMSEEGRYAVLKYVSEELRRFLEEKVLEYGNLRQTQKEFLAQIIEEVLASIQNSGTTSKIEAQFEGLSLTEDDKMNIEFDSDLTNIQAEKTLNQKERLNFS